MKTFAYILGFIFISFLFAPTVIALVDKNADVSIAYNMDEEETSSKNLIDFEFHVNELRGNEESISYLKDHEDSHYYFEKRYDVSLKILSPPPRIS